MLGANPSPHVGKADKILAEIGTEIRDKDTFRINDVGVFLVNRTRQYLIPISAEKALIEQDAPFAVHV